MILTFKHLVNFDLLLPYILVPRSLNNQFPVHFKVHLSTTPKCPFSLQSFVSLHLCCPNHNVYFTVYIITYSIFIMMFETSPLLSKSPSIDHYYLLGYYNIESFNPSTFISKFNQNLSPDTFQIALQYYWDFDYQYVHILSYSDTELILHINIPNLDVIVKLQYLI